MDWKGSLAIFGVAAGAVAAVFYADPMNWRADAAETLGRRCLPVIKNTLRSPSTLSVDHYTDMGSRGATSSDLVATIYSDDDPSEYRIHEVIVSFDAANAYGTPVRSTSSCTLILSADETLGERLVRGLTTLDLKIDGKNGIQRLQEATRALTDSQ